MINTNQKLTPERAVFLIKNGHSRKEIKAAYNLNARDYEIMCDHPDIKGIRKGIVPTLDLDAWGNTETKVINMELPTPSEMNESTLESTIESTPEDTTEFNNEIERW